MIEERSKKKNIVIAILVLFVLALGGLCTYLMFFKEESKPTDCKVVKTEDKKEETKDIQNKIEIYGKKYDTGVYYVCNHQSDTDDCKNVLITINTETATANIIRTYLSPEHSFQYVVYYDNGVKLYNVKDQSIKKVDLDLNGNIEWLPEGLIYNGEDVAYYFDLKNNKKVFDKYDTIYPVEDIHDSSYVDNLKYIYCKKGNSTTVIDFKTGNVILTISNSDYEGISFIKDGSYIIASLDKTENTKTAIYNTKGEKVVELKDNQYYEIRGSKLVIYEYEEKKVKEY